MTPNELEQALEQAKTDLAEFRTRERSPHECSHGWLDGMAQRSEAVRAAERALSAARRQEHAVVWNQSLAPRPNRLPRLFVREGRRVTLLTAVLYVPPDWQGKIVGDRLSYTEESPVARIEYRDAEVQAIKPGAIESHRLHGRGLDPTQMMQVLHPDRTTTVQHHLMMFEGAWIEIEGVPTSVEVWAVTLDEVARHCGGTALPL